MIVIVAVVVVLLVSSGSSSTKTAALPALGHRDGPETIFTAGSALTADPTGTIAELHALGVSRVRIFLPWGSIVPDGTSAHRPSFDATNPAAYPAAHWAIYDTIIRELLSHHLGLDVVLGPPPPRWAEGKGAPPPSKPQFWEPDAKEFEQFVQAVGVRYSGHYTPRGTHRPLPRVSFWSIWNEPNSGVQITPQAVQSHQVEVAPRYYRALADAAWTGLHRTGHGSDTTLIGELAPVGSNGPLHPGLFDVMTPLRFLRALYCVSSDYKPLSGAAAAARGCPTTSAASKRFAAENPVLFHATDFADHPYAFGLAPNTLVPKTPDDTNLAAIGRLFTALDKVQHAYGSSKRFQVYSTEYGYQTSPPDTQSGNVTPKLAAMWLNWGEYLTWREPRLISYNQYLLQDPPPIRHKQYRAFATGLITYSETRKPGWYAFRMPIWLPATSTSSHHQLEVWGCVRPAKTVARSKRAPAQIQWRAGSSGPWRTIARVPVRSHYGYFDVNETFPGSGSVRLHWAPPDGPAISSRTVAITMH